MNEWMNQILIFENFLDGHLSYTFPDILQQTNGFCHINIFDDFGYRDAVINTS